MLELKIDTVGKVIKGENPGWFLRIKDDTEESGGFYILQFKNKDGANGMGDAYDNWVETFEDVKSYFEEPEWKIDWLE